MFKDSDTAKLFKCGETKTAYLADDALAIEFENLLDNMKTVLSRFFSLLFCDKSKRDRLTICVAFLVRFLDEIWCTYMRFNCMLFRKAISVERIAAVMRWSRLR